MSLINAVRFININYNNDNFRINNEIYYFHGQNALLNLDNGGGKTVMVQLMMAPFLQKSKRDLGNRKFASHFLTANPSFILVEWLPDGNTNSRVLTGMMVRKNQHLNENNNNELEIINFVAEYSKEVECDIINLPVVEKKDEQLILKSFAECQSLFERFKKNRSLKFSYFDMNTPYQAKSYFDKILEYGINYKEWHEIIHEVNKEEGGLSKIFEECKDERRLIEKWFLPKIQVKLTKEKKIPEELQHTVEDFLQNRHRLDATIIQKEAILKFQEEAEQILASCEVCLKAKANELATQKYIQAALAALKELLCALKDKLALLRKNGDIYVEKLRLLESEETSLLYYHQVAVLKSVEADLAANAQTLVQIKDSLLSQKEIRNLYACAVLQKQIDSLDAKQASLKTEDEVAKNMFKEYDTELSALGGKLKTYYTLRIQNHQNDLEELNRELHSSEETGIQNKKEMRSIRQDIELLAVEAGKLEESFKNYELREDDYVATYNVRFADAAYANPHTYPLSDFEKHAETLSKTKEDLESELHKARVAKADLAKKRIQNEQQKADQNQLLKQAEVKLARCEQALARFEQEIAARKTILSYLALGSELLFETSQILAKHDTKIIELETVVNQLFDRKRELRNSLDHYQHGFLTLSQEFRTLCENMGVQLTYGFEWLKRKTMNLKDKEELLARFPLLPYALILDSADLARLQAAEPVQTFTPIPIIAREDLSGSMQDTPSHQVYFYARYETQIFEAEFLAEKIQSLEAEIQKILEQISVRQSEIKGFRERKVAIQQQTLDFQTYTKLCTERDQLGQTIKDHKEKLVGLEQMRQQMQESEETLSRQIETALLSLQTLTTQESVFAKLLLDYKNYRKAKEEYRHCKEGQDALKTKLAAAQEKNEELEGNLKILLARQSELKLLVKNLKADKLEIYAAYTEQTELEADFEVNSVEARYQTLLAAQNKHLNVNVSRIESELKEVHRNLELLNRQLEKEAIEAGFTNREWQTRLITDTELEACEEKLKILNIKLKEEQDRREQLNISLGAEESKVNHAKEALKKCSLDEPLPRESIRNLDFKSEQAKYGEQLQQIYNERTKLALLQEKLNSSAELYAQQIAEAEAGEEFPELPNYFTLEELKPEAIVRFLKNKEHELQQSRLEQDHLKLRLAATIQDIYRNDAYEPIKDILPNLEPLVNFPEKIANELPLKLQVFTDLLHMMEQDLIKIEEEKQIIINLILDYIDNVQREFKTIDSNATIKIRDQNKKILKIELPDWDENKDLFRTKIRDYLESLISLCLGALRNGENIHEPVGLALTTRELFDRIIGIPNVKISLLKVEAQREFAIPWSRVVTNSGGESFLSAFIILSSLMSYMHNDVNSPLVSGKKAGKTLIMDNPFGKTSAEHLLRPLIAIAKKNNLQLICLTALRDPAIYDRFDNIYILKLTAPNSQGVSYLKSSHQKDSATTLTQARLQVVNSDETLLEDLFSMEPEL